MHIEDNIRQIRDIRGETQAEFIKHFTNVSLAVQKAYELGRTPPKSLYLTELSSLSGIPESKLLKGKLSAEDIATIKSMVEKVHKVSQVGIGEGPSDEVSDPIRSLLKAKNDIITEKEERIKGLEKDKVFLQEILKTSLARIVQEQGTILAYQKAWVDQHAEEKSGGDKVQEKKIKARMSSRVGEHELGPVRKDNPSVPNR